MAKPSQTLLVLETKSGKTFVVEKLVDGSLTLLRNAAQVKERTGRTRVVDSASFESGTLAIKDVRDIMARVLTCNGYHTGQFAQEVYGELGSLPAPELLIRTETVGPGLNVFSADEPVEATAYDFTWEVPEDQLVAAERGTMLESPNFKVKDLPCSLRLRFFPLGCDQASAGYCSFFVWAAEDVKMQVQLDINGTRRLVDSAGPVPWEAQHDRGHRKFCPCLSSKVGVTLQMKLLRLCKFSETKWPLPERYKVGEMLGKGAYGSVRRAWDEDGNHAVAVKELRLDNFDMTDGKRVLREVKLLQSLQHTHIVQIFHLCFVEEGLDNLYIVMELCDTDLDKVCQDHRGLPMPIVRRLAYNLFVGCAYLHSKSVYHRDLKPQNCLANKDCSVKICDFNLSKAVTPDTGISSELPMPALTRSLTQHVVSRWYRAPEVILKLDYSEALDVWSIGCIMAELFGALNEGGRKPCSRALFQGSATALSRGGNRSHGDQLGKIIDVLGTPFNDPEFSLLPPNARATLEWYGEKIGKGLKSQVPAEASDDGIDLLGKLLKFFPEARITLADALLHSFFDRVKRSSSEEFEDCILDLNFDESTIRNWKDLKNEFVNEVKKYKA